MVLHGISWYCIVMHGIAWYCMVLHGIARYCTVVHGSAWYCMVLHGIAEPHGQGGLECRQPLVLEGAPRLGEDQPCCLRSAHQVEVGQLHLRHGSAEFKSKESKGAAL